MSNPVVVWVMRRRHLHHPSSKSRVDKFVSYDFELSVNEREGGGTADEVLITFVVRVDCNCCVTEHRLGSSGRNGSIANKSLRFGFVLNRVFNIVEFPFVI